MHKSSLLGLGLILGLVWGWGDVGAAEPEKLSPQVEDMLKTLRGDLKTFELHFAYVPPKDGDQSEYPSITIRVPVLRDMMLPNSFVVQIDEVAAKKILEELAGSGWLERAECIESPYRKLGFPASMPGPAYELYIYSTGWRYKERLPFNAQSYWRLMEVAQAVGGDAADQIRRPMLAQLAEKKPDWKRAGDIGAALLKEMNVRLVYTGEQPKKFFDIWFFNGLALPEVPPPHTGPVSIRPEKWEAFAIVDALAKTGTLEALSPKTLAAAEPSYHMEVRIDGKSLQTRLGWDAKMRAVLEAIAGQVPTDSQSAEVLNELLDRMEPLRPEWDKAAGLAPTPLDWEKAGDYTFGPWKYVYRFEMERDGRAIGHWGFLYYRGEMVEGIEMNDVLDTPWGKLHWVCIAETPAGPHGWMRAPDPRYPAGKEFPSARDILRYHQIMNSGQMPLMRLTCSPEKVSVIFAVPSAEVLRDLPDGVNASMLTPFQFVAGFRQLAHEGLLGKAEPDWSRRNPLPDYHLHLAWKDRRGRSTTMVVDLGPKDQAARHLQGLRSVWAGEATETLESVLKQLKDQ